MMHMVVKLPGLSRLKFFAGCSVVTVLKKAEDLGVVAMVLLQGLSC